MISTGTLSMRADGERCDCLNLACPCRGGCKELARCWVIRTYADHGETKFYFCYDCRRHYVERYRQAAEAAIDAQPVEVPAAEPAPELATQIIKRMQIGATDTQVSIDCELVNGQVLQMRLDPSLASSVAGMLVAGALLLRKKGITT